LAFAVAIGSPHTGCAQAAHEWRGPEHVYQSVCRYCHDTGVGPALHGRQLPVEYLRERVRNGFRAMPAFRPGELNDADLTRLAEWLHRSAPRPDGQ
jgi:cytochrome c5